VSTQQAWLPGFGDPVEEIGGEESLIEMILEKLVSEHSLTAISRATGISLKRLIKVCRSNGVRYPYQQATPEQIAAAIRAVLTHGLSIRAASGEVGISKSSVHRYVSRRRRRIVRKAGAFQPVSVAPYRCPRHGVMAMSPCPACEALAASGRLVLE
jgi:lambda repressor-like predicted transcriptional regulator